jgi:hypothetical protein
MVIWLVIYGLIWWVKYVFFNKQKSTFRSTTKNQSLILRWLTSRETITNYFRFYYLFPSCLQKTIFQPPVLEELFCPNKPNRLRVPWRKQPIQIVLDSFLTIEVMKAMPVGPLLDRESQVSTHRSHTLISSINNKKPVFYN